MEVIISWEMQYSRSLIETVIGSKPLFGERLQDELHLGQSGKHEWLKYQQFKCECEWDKKGCAA